MNTSLWDRTLSWKHTYLTTITTVTISSFLFHYSHENHENKCIVLFNTLSLCKIQHKLADISIYLHIQQISFQTKSFFVFFPQITRSGSEGLNQQALVNKVSSLSSEPFLGLELHFSRYFSIYRGTIITTAFFP